MLDALTAAYTGWLGLGRLVAPPPDFNLASGWIWMPRTTEGAPAAVINPDGPDPTRPIAWPSRYLPGLPVAYFLVIDRLVALAGKEWSR